MTDPEYPKTPQLDKILSAEERIRPLREFLAWLSERNLVIAEESGDVLAPVSASPQRLVAEWIGVDLSAADMEILALVSWVRKNGSAVLVKLTEGLE